MEASGSKLTQKRVGMAIREAMRAKRDVTIWCTEPRGFGCRVRPSGVASYIFQFRSPGGRAGRTQKITIGRSTTFSPDEARVIARGHAQKVALGEDPRGPEWAARRFAEDQQARERAEAEAEAAERAKPTLASVFDLFAAQNAGRLSQKTLDGMRGHLRAPLETLAERPLDELRRVDIATLHASLTETPYLANRALATVSTLFSFAERMELAAVGANPARGVRRYRERHRERLLSADEIAALWRALLALEAVERHRFSAKAIRLGMLTGWRVGEVRTLEWRDVDLQSAEAMVHGKTGARRAPIPEAAREVLERVSAATRHYGIGEHHGRWVFPTLGGAEAEQGALTDWEHRRSWDKAVAVSGVDDIRRHDLRHLVAGVIGMQTGSALRVKEAMGHRSVSVSERYISPISELQRRSTDQAAALIHEIAEGRRDGLASNGAHT